MVPADKIPRIVIAATGSGVGKTTATVALMGALRARGLKVAAFKCGPDYLDPTYHERAAGVRSHNLDGWMMDRDTVIATFARASADADIAVIEGMMGLFDSATPTGDEGSTAQIAKWLDAPVILVTDASGIARTIAAVAAGFARFDPAVRVAGMICNRVGGRGHLDLLRAVQPEVPIVGGFPAQRRSRFSRAPSRPADGRRIECAATSDRRMEPACRRMAGPRRDPRRSRARRLRSKLIARLMRNNRFEFTAAMPNRCRVRRRVSLLLRRQFESPPLARRGDRQLLTNPRSRTARSGRTLFRRRISRGVRARTVVEHRDARGNSRLRHARRRDLRRMRRPDVPDRSNPHARRRAMADGCDHSRRRGRCPSGCRRSATSRSRRAPTRSSVRRTRDFAAISFATRLSKVLRAAIGSIASIT